MAGLVILVGSQEVVGRHGGIEPSVSPHSGFQGEECISKFFDVLDHIEEARGIDLARKRLQGGLDHRQRPRARGICSCGSGSTTIAG